MKKAMVFALLILAPAWAAIASEPASPSLAAKSVSQQEQNKAVARRVRWEQDIDAFVQGMSAGQIDFEKLYPPEKFNAEIASLKASIGTRSDAEIVLQLMRIVAIAHVAHNSVETILSSLETIPKGMGFEKKLPLTFAWLSDGMMVSSATAAYRETIGHRVVSIGSLTPDELQNALEPFISYENEQRLRLQAAGLMTYQPVLSELRLLEPDGSVNLILDSPGKKPLRVDVPFLEDPKPVLNHYDDALGIPLRMRLMQRDRNYWYRYLKDSQTAYVQYSFCYEDPKLSFHDFVNGMMADLDARPVKRIIIDLRRNPGGSSPVIDPLVRTLKARKQWNGKIYVLIGPETFSSAVMNAGDLKRKLHATLIGEPTGGGYAGYGEVKRFTLPNSKLVIRYTTKFFAAPKGMEGSALVPDLIVRLTIPDVLAGRDPVLEAAIHAK